ncbi:MAG: hypothetical protein ACRD1K_16595 [Acidimicrobiales bacterium]
MTSRATVVLDDRVLIEELLVGLRTDSIGLTTTAYWYYRASRAAVLGAGGHLSGSFERVDDDDQQRAITSLLQLRDDIALPDPRRTVPEMVAIAGRHPRLKLLNLEAVAVGRLLRATMWLSEDTARGILPAVLEAENVAWETITIP